MKKLLNTIIVFTLLTTFNAQDRPSESLSLINNTLSNNNLYSGTVDVKIPLFEIPVGTLNLTNDLSYKSQPFDPNVDESMVGLNWNLNIFGQITREVNTDFLFRQYLSNSVNAGFVYPISEDYKQRQGYDCLPQKQNLQNGFVYPKTQILYNPNVSDVKNEYKPDKFYFDFFGYKGYFVYDNHGKVIVYCENAKLKVLDSQSSASKCYSVISPIDYTNTNLTEIKIIDDKGNTFYFGGSYDAVETSYVEFTYSSLNTAGRTRANYIISWNLKKVELSNGDIIMANYKQGNASVFNNFLQETLTATNFPTGFPSDTQLDQANIITSESFYRTYLNYTSGLNINVTKRAIINSIEVVNKNINIQYNYIKDSNQLVHLSGINLNYFGKSENIEINQIPLGGQNYRYFLESIIKGNGEKFLFNYYKTENLPSKGTAPINKYGYWSGNGSNEVFDATLLQKITYPTKGFEYFNYEKTNASRISQLNSSNDFNVSYSISSYDAINIPIPRISNKLVNNGIDQYIVNYKYLLDNGSSSGIFKYFLPQSFIVQNKKSSGDPFYYYYSQVEEETIGKGKIRYTFTDLFTNPDINNVKYIDGTTVQKANANIPSNEYQRGKLLRKRIYNASNTLLKEHYYEYNSFLRPESELVDLALNACSNCKISDENYYIFDEIVYRNINTQIPQKSRTAYIPVIPYLLKKERIIDYMDNQIITDTEIKYRESNVNWHPYPEQVDTTTPQGTSIKKYLYAHDVKISGCRRGCPVDETIIGGQQPTYTAMINSNIMYPVIEIFRNENNKYFLKENLFFIPSFVHKNIRQTKLNANVSFTNYNVNVDQAVQSVSYDLIDDKSNYIQITDKSGIPTVIIYGYKQSFPILKIVGLTYGQFMQMLGQSTSVTDYLNLSIVTKSNADIDTASEQLLIDELDIFRNNTSLKDYQITTYTYDPLVGVTSITPPSGIREVYIYDTTNRLKEIRENNASGKLLKEFKYNYKP